MEPARTHVVAALEQHHDACFAWALACCRYRRADAEDVLQQAYLRILDGSAVFAERSSPRTFLFGVIRRCAQEQRRRAAVRAALTGRIVVDLLTRLGGADAGNDHTAVRRALRSLSARQREVLELVAYHDLTIERAAGVLGISVGSARTHYERGKHRLATLLAPEVTP